MPGAGNFLGDLDAHELAAFTGLGALGNLDLNFRRCDQVLSRDAEACGSHLLGGGADSVRVIVRVLPAFSAVAAPANLLHGKHKIPLGFRADGSKRHGP